MSKPVLIVSLCAALAAGTHAAAEPPAKEVFAKKHTAAAMPPESLGFYSKGCLAGAAQLSADGPAWQAMRLSRDRRWGHPETVRFLQRLAGTVRARGIWPGLLIGDISMARGGPMPFGHSSHQVGLDADIWLQPMPSVRLSEAEREDFPFQSVLREGTFEVDERIWTNAYRDVIRLAAVDPDVQRIFVHPGIKKKLCETAEGGRAWLNKVRPYYGHHEHFHVRLRCQPGSDDCKPQRSTGTGDGCGDLYWWFDVALQPPKPGTPPPKPKPPLTMSDLPGRCRAVAEAPASGSTTAPIEEISGLTSFAGPATVPIPKPRPIR